MINVNKTMDKFIKNYDDKMAIRKGLLSLLNNENFLNIHPEAKEQKNLILSKIDKNFKEQKDKTNSLKIFAFLERVANDIIGDKANKLVKLQNLMERTNIPLDVKSKISKAKEKMSQNIVNAYGILKQAIESGNDKDFKTAVVSILSLTADSEQNKNLAIFIFKDINEESDIDFNKVEQFFKENKELIKLDKYIEEFEKLVSVKEKEQKRQKNVSNVSF